MALIERKVILVLSYSDGAGGSNQYTLENHRVSATITNAGSPGLATANIRVFGMTLSEMNQFSTIGLIPGAYWPNMLTLIAGDDTNGYSTVYIGTILSAWADMMGAPDIAFTMVGGAGLYESLTPIPPSSFPGTADAAVILQSLASKAITPAYPQGLKLENNGVSAILSTPYYPFSLLDQIKAVCHDANCEYTIELDKLAIWPRGASRMQAVVPLINADSGMVGYPTYTGTGIVVTTIFNPTIRQGASVAVESSLTPANRDDWHVTAMNHELEANLPDGKWFTQVQLAVPGYDAAH